MGTIRTTCNLAKQHDVEIASVPYGEGRYGKCGVLTDRRIAEHRSTVEVKRCGLPVVAADCAHGPGEITDNGVDGRLVQVGNVGAIAEGLLELINNKALQHRSAGAVLKDSECFDPAGIAECYEPITAAPQAADFFNTMVRWEAP
ncbi:glycosyltransferase [Streptomyces sp. NPDC006365]|uniref:glycosyltransferase n=1 Tax=Streptomyces sp. NPDC006365 TaxID=3364744 RepID=UPI003675DE76